MVLLPLVARTIHSLCFRHLRYDYENVESDGADQMMSNLREMVANKSFENKQYGEYTVSQMDDFEYVDPVDESVTERQVVEG